VLLFPSAQLTVDVVEFDDLSLRAVADSDPATARAAIARYAGELLPDDRYADWAYERRELLRLRHLHLLRLAGQWVELSELDPSDEDAHVAVMRRHAANGDHDAALDQYARMERILDAQLGIAPGHEARALRHDLETARASRPAPVVPLHLHRAPERSAPARVLVADEVAALMAELAELTRRQATLLEALAGVGVGVGVGAMSMAHISAAS
jgi:DNA-binding SARP family transcriptional activator